MYKRDDTRFPPLPAAEITLYNVDHILVINKTDIEVYKGNFSTWWEEKKRRDNWEREEKKL